MRHPTSGLSEDDLSRLTGSSITTSSSTPSHENNCNGNNNDETDNYATIPIISDHHQHHHDSTINLKNAQNNFVNLTYFPEFIDPLEWQKSRKRKERQDSTSSTTQDRKLVRSNSEELITNADCEVIRRVSSHEDFKKPLQEINDGNVLKAIQEGSQANENDQQESNNPIDITSFSRQETSPARSYRFLPKQKDYDEYECEHERRRSSERLCKSRANSGRKAGVIKKSSKQHIFTRYRPDENAYKYDISSLKYERRGFVSKVKLEERNRKEEAADGEQITTNDYNDNNLIDFHMRDNYKNGVATVKPSSQSFSYNSQQQPQQHKQTIAEALPWDSSVREDQTPVLSRRFESIDNYSNDDSSNSRVITCPSPAVVVDNEPVKSFRIFTKMENVKTREIMQNLTPLQGLYQTPEERLSHVNKKLQALKRKVAQLEEAYEKQCGYRPSQIEKFNDKQIKSVLAEIGKLRKEKHELKSDPMTALGLKVSGGMDAGKRLGKMKETLSEIEKKLDEKRQETNRPEILEELNADQLMHEKAAVQHSLLYFESLYGRPSTREERDAVRPLYDRYRMIKRMISRSISISGGVSDILPTILEHEAMAFNADSSLVHQQSQSETISSPDYNTGATSSATVNSPPSNNDSPSDNSGSAESTESSNTANTNQSACIIENIHTLSLAELWELLEKAREEKKQLKRAINEFEMLFEEQNGRKMLKTDRKTIDDTYTQYKQKKAKVRLLQALIKKHISN